MGSPSRLDVVVNNIRPHVLNKAVDDSIDLRDGIHACNDERKEM